MAFLLFATILFGIGCNHYCSGNAVYLHKASDKIESDEDGEKLINNLVNGKKFAMDYKFNEDMLHFLHLKGLIKNEEVKKLEEHFFKANGSVNTDVQTTLNKGIDNALVRRKRNGRIVGDSKEFIKDCCCPSRSIQIPAFITDSRFDEVIERINGMKKDTSKR